jgi:hypothetical protein
MAELINEIISPEAFKQVADMKAELASLTKQMEDMLKAMGKAPAVGGGNAVKSTTDAIQAQSEQMKQLQIVKNKIITTEAKLNDEYVQQAARLKELNSELRANVAQTGLAEGSLDQMRNNLNKLEKLYSAMSAEMRNAKVGQTIFADMVKAKEGVTLLEQSMGNYKRNVGNYQNSTFQLTQTLRELPAFAYSAQTGLMGISNNLPLLADAFSKVKQETGSTMGAIKVFGASLFSFSNIFAVAIGLTTMFLPKLIEWASSTKNVANAYKDLDEAQKEGQKNAIKEQASLETLYKTMTNTNKSMSERLLAVDKLQSQYPDYFGNLSKEDLLVGNASVAYQNLRNDILSVAKARAIEDKIATIYTETLDEELRLKEEMRKADALSAVDRNKQIEIQTRGGLDKELRTQKLSIEASNKHREDKKRIAFAEYQDFLATREAQLKVLKDAVQKETTIINTGGGAKDSKSGGKSQIAKATEELKTYAEAVKNINFLPELESTFEPKFLDKGIADTLKRLQAIIKQSPVIIPVNVELTNGEKVQQWAEKALPIAKEIVKITGEITGSLGDLSQSLFDREMMQLDAKQKKAQETYDAEKAQIEQLSLSEEEKAKRIAALDAQKKAQDKKAEQERLQIARKQAAVQKAINISNIIGQTALAVITQFASLPIATQIPRAILAGSIGAIQLAAAVAAPLPQFAEGTQNAPEGYAVVGERGTELVVNPDGTSWLTPAKDTITYLKQGAKVIPNNELMDMVKYANYVNVGGIKQGETGGLFGMALVSKFDELADEVRGLKMIMANKNMNVQVSGNYDHYLHVRKNIR